MAVNSVARTPLSASDIEGWSFHLIGPAHDITEDSLELTDTSYGFIKQTLKETTREGVLRRRTRLLCQSSPSHGVQPVTDCFPNGEILLACGGRRQLFLRKPAEVNAYDTAVDKREKRKLVSCRSHHGTYVRVFMEEVEEQAA